MAVGATIAAMMKATGWQYSALLPGVLLQSCRATAATQDAPSHSQDPAGPQVSNKSPAFTRCACAARIWLRTWKSGNLFDSMKVVILYSMHIELIERRRCEFLAHEATIPGTVMRT